MHNDPQTASSSSEIGPARRAVYLWKLLKLYGSGYRRNFDSARADRELEDDRRLASRYGVDLRTARVLEVGFGQFPFRLLWMHGAGIDVRGLDLELPQYRPGSSRLMDIVRTNGAVRAAKTAVRSALFDRSIWQDFILAWERRFQATFEFPWSRMLVGDAALPETWARTTGEFDVIYSEDVFEHIPRLQLERVLLRMAENLADRGIAIIKPLIFTGITGSHDPEWYDDQVRRGTPDPRAAWQHLRRSTPLADTVLNRLSRREFREMFSHKFDILEDRSLEPDLGRAYLSPKLARELKAYPEDELFSNKVCFVLRKRRADSL